MALSSGLDYTVAGKERGSRRSERESHLYLTYQVPRTLCHHLQEIVPRVLRHTYSKSDICIVWMYL